MNFPIRQRLTKRFFMGLPAEVYLASNNYEMKPYPLPVFSEYIAQAGEARNFQWEMLKSIGAVQQTCDVFRDKEEFAREVD